MTIRLRVKVLMGNVLSRSSWKQKEQLNLIRARLNNVQVDKREQVEVRV